MADYGIKISKPGYDVNTADGTDLVFYSGIVTHKIYSTGTTGTGVNEVSHSLGYPPLADVYRIDDNKVYKLVEGEVICTTDTVEFSYDNVFYVIFYEGGDGG